MTDRHATETSAFGQYLLMNYPTEPEYVVRGPSGDVIAAKWHRPAGHNATDGASAQHTLMYHIGGSTSVAKFVEGRCVGTRSLHGSLTFRPRDENNEWIRGGVCEVMHVYIAPSLIERYVEENFGQAAVPEVDPLFAAHDPWLQSYFTMLRSEFEIFGDDRKHPDALLLTQSMELLIRHLVGWHSNLSQQNRRRAMAPAAPHPLAPRHLTRVLAYIDDNLAGDIALADLAGIASMSRDHFIRGFRAATQRTPYAYLVERRLARAVDALKRTDAPVEQIARQVGFKSAPGFSNVFKKHHGMSPSKFRARSR
ncbi:MAG TPA: AraC family transcriptional regulator [Stellaceae bacterium]|nr:AraC family transcriptional regulator [Stellaceae bacterium]